MTKLSIIMPFYKRVRALQRALKANQAYLTSSSELATEVVLVLDEPSQERAVLKLVKSYKQISWRVIINRVDHPWRNPARAINVGIRHSKGEFVLVMSPESLYVTNMPGALMQAATRSNSYSVGRICWCPRQIVNEMGLAGAFERTEPKIYYGSICGPRDAFEQIRGYDESNHTWGCDDDNIRLRFKLQGLKLKYEHFAMAIHPLEKGEVNHNRIMQREKTSGERKRYLRPVTCHANDNEWGRDFDEMLYERMC